MEIIFRRLSPLEALASLDQKDLTDIFVNILTETELSYVQSQGTRWASAAEIANLLQLEKFPLTMATPAAIDLEFVKQEDAVERQPPELIPPPPE